MHRDERRVLRPAFLVLAITLLDRDKTAHRLVRESRGCCGMDSGIHDLSRLLIELGLVIGSLLDWLASPIDGASLQSHSICSLLLPWVTAD